eukprot:3844812-Ditylum_brightwellii.AAC.1
MEKLESMQPFRKAKRTKTNEWNDHYPAYQNKSDLLGKELQNINERFDQIHKEQEKHRDNSAAKDDILQINVGGTIISASRGILSQQKGTVLEVLFSGRWKNKLQ